MFLTFVLNFFNNRRHFNKKNEFVAFEKQSLQISLTVDAFNFYP